MDIFVFGSNTQGRHGKGAALEARKRWGALMGQPYGLQGRSFAIVTKELRADHKKVDLKLIDMQVSTFLLYAWTQPDDTFWVTPIGCRLAGFSPEQIAPMFTNAPDNVRLPKEFRAVLERKVMTLATEHASVETNRVESPRK